METEVLTSREKQVLLCICEELTSKEIAQRLNITEKTVEFHRDRIRRRIGVKATAGIVRYAIRHGLIQP